MGNSRSAGHERREPDQPAARVLGTLLAVAGQLHFVRRLRLFHQLAAHPNTEIIGVEPYHSLLFYIDIEEDLHVTR